MIFLAAPKAKQQWYWRVGELHVMRSDGCSDDRVHKGKRVQCRQQSDYQFGYYVLIVVLGNDDDLVLADREVEEQDQGLEALLFLHFSLLQQRPPQRRPLQIMLHCVGLPPFHLRNSQIWR